MNQSKTNYKDRGQLILAVFGLCFLMMGCGNGSSSEEEEELVFSDTITVTASAYNSLQLQGEGDANITAWGDTLRPGVRSIAVSRDLLRRGLSYGTPVAIEGLNGIFIVNDKMHHRWRNKIDIYMGIDKKKAMDWGRKKLKISFPGEPEEEVQ